MLEKICCICKRPFDIKGGWVVIVEENIRYCPDCKQKELKKIKIDFYCNENKI